MPTWPDHGATWRAGTRRRNTMDSHSRGLPHRFKPIDLAIVLAIGVVLVGLASGVYLRAAEASGRTRCTDNLRAIGVGIQNRLSSTGFFPVGRDPKTGNTLFYAIHDQTDLGP